MAKTPENAVKLLTDMVPAATAKARDEAAQIQTLDRRENGGFTLGRWDWEFYAEQVRKAEYDLDESQIKPYFELDRVLQDGVFYAANQLYGLTFKERNDLPVYQPDVRVFEVFDADGKLAGAVLRRLLQARTTRAAAPGWTLRRPEPPARHEAGRHNVDQLHEARAGQPALLSASTT